MKTAKQLIEEIIQDSYLKESSDKHIEKLPPNTTIHRFQAWSEWDGKLAMVDGPTYFGYSHSEADPYEFNAETSERCYKVRFAVDEKGHRLSPLNKSVPGTGIVLRDRNAQYYNTTWTIGKPGYGPVEVGSFERDVESFWVKVGLKELVPAEVHSTIKMLNAKKFFDIGGYSDLSLPASDWKKLMRCHNFNDTQAFSVALADAADRLVTRLNYGKSAVDDADYQRIWSSIEGIYKTTKGGTAIAFVLWK